MNLKTRDLRVEAALRATLSSLYLQCEPSHALFTNHFNVNSVTVNTCGELYLLADKQQICVGLAVSVVTSV